MAVNQHISRRLLTSLLLATKRWIPAFAGMTGPFADNGAMDSAFAGFVSKFGPKSLIIKCHKKKLLTKSEWNAIIKLCSLPVTI